MDHKSSSSGSSGAGFPGCSLWLRRARGQCLHLGSGRSRPQPRQGLRATHVGGGVPAPSEEIDAAGAALVLLELEWRVQAYCGFETPTGKLSSDAAMVPASILRPQD